MKNIALIFALLSSCYVNGQCNCNYSFSGSLSFGANKVGVTEAIELGAWGIKQPFGLFTGIKQVNLIKYNVINGKQGSSYTTISSSGTLRLTYKLYQNKANTIYHTLTIYGATDQDLGISYRAYWLFASTVLGGIELFSGVKYSGANLICTIAF